MFIIIIIVIIIMFFYLNAQYSKRKRVLASCGIDPFLCLKAFILFELAFRIFFLFSKFN